METVESPPTLIRPETFRSAPACRVPFKLRVLPKVPVLLSVRVVTDEISVAP
jgi:hypothetical protein